jgi:hypothetical protein
MFAPSVIMKTTGILILSLSLIFSGCKKDDDAPAGGIPQMPSTAWSFSAKVNGNVVQADSMFTMLHIDTSLGIPHRGFIIMAYCDTHSIVTGFVDTLNSTWLNIASYNSPDSTGIESHLNYGSPHDPLIAFPPPGVSDFSFSTIDNINQKVSGHFSGVIITNFLGDTISITNGVFNNIHYEVW